MINRKRILALLLAVCLIWGLMPPVLAAPAQEKASKSLTIAPGVTYTQGVYEHSSLGREAMYTAEYIPNPAVSVKVGYGSKLYGSSTISSVAANLESAGYDVVAGINADFFSLATGLPMGIVVSDGRLISSDAGFNAVGFTPDSRTLIGVPAVSVSLTTPDGGSVLIDHVNKLRSHYGLYLLTPDFSSSMHTSVPGISVMLEVLEGDLRIGSSVKAAVTGVIDPDINMAIPDNTYILTTDAQGPVDALSGITAGMEVTISVSAAPGWQEVTEAVGCGDILLTNGSIMPSLSSAVHPRTALGVKADGTVIMLCLDGRQSGYSAGIGLVDLAEQMQQMGCVSAVNFDGGGSSVISAALPGYDAPSVKSSPSDGASRRCANYLFLVNNAPAAAGASMLHIYPYDVVVLKGASLELSALATDANYKSAAVPPGVVYSSSVENISGSVFTATQTGTGTIEAQAGTISGQTGVTVLSEVDSVRVTTESSSSSLSSLSVLPSSTTDLKGRAYKDLSEVIASDLSFTFSVSGEIGTIDERGVFTACDTAGRKGAITMSYGSRSVSIPVTVGTTPILLDSFEGGANNWSLGAVGSGASGAISVATNSADVIRGRKSLELTASFPGGEPAAVQFVTSLTFSKAPSHINLQVTGDGSGSTLYVITKNASGAVAFTKAAVLDFTDTRLLCVAVPAAQTSFAGLSVEGTDHTRLVADQIVAAYSYLVDTSAPVISVTTHTHGGSAASHDPLQAKISDNGLTVLKSRISLTADGVSLPFVYDDASELLSAQLPDLAPGIHILTIETYDASGNIARTSLLLHAGEAAPFGFSDTDGHWASAYIDYVAGRGIVSGEINDLTGERFFFPDRNMTRQEFCKVMVGYLGLDTDSYASVDLPMRDLSAIAGWALPYVKVAYASGIMTGRALDDGSLIFDPAANITRQEIMTVMGKTLKKGYVSAPLAYSDVSSIADWALPYVSPLVSIGVISGYSDGTLRPTANAKRSEVAKMLTALM